MQRRLLNTLITALVVMLFAGPVQAQFSRDKAANSKIDEAINKHYFATEFDKAENILTGTLNACEDKCSPAVKARAWMYIGIVRGSGKSDVAGAEEAFATALSLDPQVKLDADISSAETKQAFAAAGGRAKTGTPTPPPAGGGDDLGGVAAGGPVGGEMACTPVVAEIQTRRPMPVSCASEGQVASAELRFKPFGSEEWISVPMKKNGEYYQAEIPCSATQNAGAVRWYVRAKNAGGEAIDNYGSKDEPVLVSVTNDSIEEPPAYPGMPAPERCVASEECPPDFPGCSDGGEQCGDKDWGSACGNSTECKCGLLCISGSCETAPSCISDIDCPVGACVGGTCKVEGGSDDDGDTGPFSRHRVGLHFQADLMLAGGNDVCYSVTQQGGRFACYTQFRDTGNPAVQARANEAYPRTDPNTGFTVEEPYYGKGIATGFALGTMRGLLSYDFALTRSLSLGARLGYAFAGGAPTDFFPFHVEGRFTYYLLDPRNTLSPYIGLSGGLAEVNAKFSTSIRNCSSAMPDYAACANANEQTPFPGASGLERIPVDVYQKAGRTFGGAHLGALINFGRFSVQVNVNAMVLFPTFGIAISPSLGAGYSF